MSTLCVFNMLAKDFYMNKKQLRAKKKEFDKQRNSRSQASRSQSSRSQPSRSSATKSSSQKPPFPKPQRAKSPSSSQNSKLYNNNSSNSRSSNYNKKAKSNKNVNKGFSQKTKHNTTKFNNKLTPEQNEARLRRQEIINNRPRKNIKRKKNYSVYYILLSIILIISGTVLARNYLFQVSQIDVITTDSYDKKKIINDSGGYASDRWQAMTDFLKSYGYTEEELVSAYLSARSSKGNLYDIFRNRIIFPIIDLRGNVIAFGGRQLGEGGPKYLNSGDTPVFKKSNGLFALNIAKKSTKDKFILAEGYMDVISLHQAGFSNAIATLGTALTGQQAKLIADYAKTVVVAYDSDEAGQKATKRAMEIFSKESVSVQILQMENAKDPDEYIKKFGRERFEMLIDGASSALDFEILKLRGQYDIKDTQGRIDYLTKACSILAQIPSPILQDIYCARLASETNADKASIKLQLQQSQQKYNKNQGYQRDKSLLKEGLGATIKIDYRQPGNSLTKVFAQQQIMAALIRDKDMFEMVNSQLSESEFTDTNMKNSFEVYKRLKSEGENVSYALLCHYIEEPARKDLAKINATNADIIITSKDLQMHIDNLKSAPLQQQDIKKTSVEDLAQRIQGLKEKKK